MSRESSKSPCVYILYVVNVNTPKIILKSVVKNKLINNIYKSIYLLRWLSSINCN